MNQPRFIIASIVTPWLPAIGFAFAGLRSESFQWNFVIFGFATFVSYLGLFVFGFPIIHILRRLGWLTLPLLVLSGAVVGIIVFHLFLVFLGFLLGSSSSTGTAELLWGAVLGASVALSFALVAGITSWSRRTR